MWLKTKIMNLLLAKSRLTRSQLAKELECSESRLNEIIDGRAGADEELSRLIIAAFGAADMVHAIDWRRSAA